MRTAVLTLSLLLLASLLPVTSWAQTVTTTGGVTIIRGSSSKPKPAEPAASDAGSAEQGEEGEAKAEGGQTEVKRPERVTRSSRTFQYDASGRRRAVRESTASEKEGKEGAAVTTYENSNGRRVPYIREKETVVSKGKAAETREKRTQLYDTAGNPTQQELVRTEERRLADGTVVTTSTTYRSDLNGRMQPVEREVERVKEKGAVTTTSKTVERPTVNGSFGAIKREESTERKQGDSASTIETVRSIGDGSGRLQVAEREQTTMKKQGSTSTTETEVFARNVATGEMGLSERTVGVLQERADGSSSEKIETYGFRLQGGGTNLNAQRMQLQEVVERRTTKTATGETRERTSVRVRDVANPSEFAPAKVTQKVSTPSGDGETVRTNIYEQSVNGRMRPAGVVVEEVKK